MTIRPAVYWTATAIITSELIVGGATDLARGREVILAGQPVVEVLAHLGYPAYLLSILGVWKLLGAATLLAPGLPRLKEWAYAGVLFELTGAVMSHVAIGDGLDVVAGPCFLALFAVASWAFRPKSRMLGALALPGRPSHRSGPTQSAVKAGGRVANRT